MSYFSMGEAQCVSTLTYSQNRYTASLAYSVEGQEMLVGIMKSHCKGRTCQILVLSRRARGLDWKKTEIVALEGTTVYQEVVQVHIFP